MIRELKANNFFKIIGFALCRFVHATEKVAPTTTLARQLQLQYCPKGNSAGLVVVMCGENCAFQ